MSASIEVLMPRLVMIVDSRQQRNSGVAGRSDNLQECLNHQRKPQVNKTPGQSLKIGRIEAGYT